MQYLAARRKVLTLGGDALVVVDVVLPTVLGLVLVREAGVEAWSVSWAVPRPSPTAPGGTESSAGAAGSFAGPRWAAYRLFL